MCKEGKQNDTYLSLLRSWQRKGDLSLLLMPMETGLSTVHVRDIINFTFSKSVFILAVLNKLFTQ